MSNTGKTKLVHPERMDANGDQLFTYENNSNVPGFLAAGWQVALPDAELPEGAKPFVEETEEEKPKRGRKKAE